MIRLANTASAKAAHAGKVFLLSLNPDLTSRFGHFLAHDMRLHEAAAEAGIELVTLANQNCLADLADQHAYVLPFFRDHSWLSGTVSSDAQKKRKFYKQAFADDLTQAVTLARRLADNRQIVIYLYCGAIGHIEPLLDAADQHPDIKFNLTLFWLFKSGPADFSEGEVTSLLHRAMSTPNCKLFAPTTIETLNISRQLGYVLESIPHPSTTFGDNDVAALCGRSPRLPENEAIHVGFPGLNQLEKGVATGLEVASRLEALGGKNGTSFVPIVRRLERAGVDSNVLRLMEDMESRIHFVDGEMNEAAFRAFLERMDIAVLPYGEAFRARTSGLLIDCLYLGIPVIVRARTWLADVVKTYGGGEIVHSDEASDYVDAVVRVASSLADNQVRARVAARHWFAENSWADLIGALTAA